MIAELCAPAELVFMINNLNRFRGNLEREKLSLPRMNKEQ